VAITILCPTCSTRLSLTDDHAGQQFTCPRCDAKMMIPGMAAPLPAQWAEPPAPMPSSRRVEDDDEPVPKRRSRRRNDNDYDDDERSPRHRGFECPYCGSHRMPLVKSQISQTGWIVFALLLIFTVCLCFIGLFITEEYRVCRDCGMKLS
jgi:DNA-directed RNA polymerase subunit RPC12/RpoP